MDDDFAACADVCESRGFVRQAELLRAVAAGWLQAFAVVERPSDGEYLEEHGGLPRAIYLDREEAEREARDRNIRAFRERNLFDFCDGSLQMATDLSLGELEHRIGESLGRPYTLPEADDHDGPLFPADASDAQILAVMGWFTLRFFDVTEVTLAG